jgi:ABC-2 type transport system ATP-binding protein
VIKVDRVAARERPMVLASVSAAWGAGVHAVLGTPADGGPLLLALLAGAARARAGSIEVLGGSPEAPEVRRQVARVPLVVSLPEALRVDEVLAVAAAVRHEAAQAPERRLAALGVEALATRKVRSLSRPEARAVALAEAVTSTRVRVLLVEEPFVLMDPRASARLSGVLRERASSGCAVIVETASPRDAGELADDHLLLRAGAVAGRASSMEELAGFSPEGARLRVVARDPDDARAIAAALAADPDVQAVEHRGAAVVARGDDATRLAKAAGRAVVAADRDVSEIRIEPPSLDEARASAAGIATATYQAARTRTRAALEGPADGAAPVEPGGAP